MIDVISKAGEHACPRLAASATLGREIAIIIGARSKLIRRVAVILNYFIRHAGDMR